MTQIPSSAGCSSRTTLPLFSSASFPTATAGPSYSRRKVSIGYDDGKCIGAVAEGKASDLLEKQREMAGRHCNGGTGCLFVAMSSVSMMRGNRQWLNYPLYIRFLDLSRIALQESGRRITLRYAPNVSYGYLYIGIYVPLRQGLSGMVRQTVMQIFSD